MYKDKEKQKAANRAAAQRRRDSLKGMTQDSHTVIPIIPTVPRKVIPDSHTQNVIPKQGIDKALVEVRVEMKKEGEFLKELADSGGLLPKPQSHSPMMVGYVPPRGGQV